MCFATVDFKAVPLWKCLLFFAEMCDNEKISTERSRGEKREKRKGKKREREREREKGDGRTVRRIVQRPPAGCTRRGDRNEGGGRLNPHFTTATWLESFSLALITHPRVLDFSTTSAPALFLAFAYNERIQGSMPPPPLSLCLYLISFKDRILPLIAGASWQQRNNDFLSCPFLSILSSQNVCMRFI